MNEVQSIRETWRDCLCNRLNAVQCVRRMSFEWVSCSDSTVLYIYEDVISVSVARWGNPHFNVIFSTNFTQTPNKRMRYPLSAPIHLRTETRFYPSHMCAHKRRLAGDRMRELWARRGIRVRQMQVPECFCLCCGAKFKRKQWILVLPSHCH